MAAPAFPVKGPYGQDVTRPSPSYPPPDTSYAYTPYGAGQPAGQPPPGNFGAQQQYPGAAYMAGPGPAGPGPTGHAMPPPMHMSPMDMEEGRRPQGTTAEEKWNADVRRGFVQKVLFIVFVQLLITTGICMAFFFVKPIKDYVVSNYWVMITSWAVAFAMIIVLSCSTRVRRRYPYNYVFLILFTLVFAVMAACITARYDVREVGMALAVTAATVFGAFFVAKFTKLDLTGAGGFLLAIFFGVLVMSIIGAFWRNKWFYFAIALIAAILFTAYLIYDLQLLMGGRKYEISPDEYIAASISIYLDIVQIFLNILQIIGLVNRF